MDAYLVALAAKLSWVQQFPNYYVILYNGFILFGPWDVDDGFLIVWPTPQVNKTQAIPILSVAQMGGDNIPPAVT